MTMNDSNGNDGGDNWGDNNGDVMTVTRNGDNDCMMEVVDDNNASNDNEDVLAI